MSAESVLIIGIAIAALVGLGFGLWVLVKVMDAIQEATEYFRRENARARREMSRR